MDYSWLNIIDLHVHFPVDNTLALSTQSERHPHHVDYAKSRSEKMRYEQATEVAEPVAKTAEEIDAYVARWANEVERYGLRRVNFVSGGGNSPLQQIITRHPDKFTGFAHHKLEPGGHVALQEAVEKLGLRGYKLVGPLTEYPFEHPGLTPLWEYCAQQRLPVLIHFGWLGRGGGIVDHPRLNPLSLFETARAFPEIPFVIPHFGVNHWADVLALAWSLPNIYIDTSGSNQWRRWMPYPLSYHDLFAKAYEQLGPERILFGTDSSYFPRGFSLRYLQDQLRVCYQLNMGEDDIKLIFGGNAARLLKLEQD